MIKLHFMGSYFIYTFSLHDDSVQYNAFVQTPKVIFLKPIHCYSDRFIIWKKRQLKKIEWHARIVENNCNQISLMLGNVCQKETEFTSTFEFFNLFNISGLQLSIVFAKKISKHGVVYLWTLFDFRILVIFGCLDFRILWGQFGIL